MRRAAALALLPRLLSGCGDAPPMTAAPVAPAAAEEPGLELELGARRLHAALLQEHGERRLWRSTDGVALATEGARVVATAGLPQMVSATRFDGPDPLDEPLALEGTEARSRRLVDLAGEDRSPSGMQFGLALECRLRGVRESAALLRIEERCEGEELSFTNRFWAEVAGGGAIARSEQWIGPYLPILAVERW